MDPRIEHIQVDGDILRFTLEGVNVSLANSLRRTILSDIDLVVFKTTPYEENKANILSNTSKFNNEIIKQRLSCIPIHITDFKFPLENYLLEVNVENLTDTIQYVTTEDFKIKNVVTNEYLSKNETIQIFPPGDHGYYIDFLRLLPKISDGIPGEKIHLTCEFSKSNARENGLYNAVSTCSYAFTPNKELIEKELAKKKHEWKQLGLDAVFLEKDWRLLDAMRLTKKDSFDFVIQTVGVFTNEELVEKACNILNDKLLFIDTQIETDEIKIVEAVNTMTNCYDIIIENEDYTIGKALEYMMYSKYFEGIQILSYCGFKKMHPHDADSIIRVAYKEDTDLTTIKTHVKYCVEGAVAIFTKITSQLHSSRVQKKLTTA